MNKVFVYILSILCLTSCHEMEELYDAYNADAVELTGVEASVYGSASTRAAALDKYNYVGRSAFIDKDSMTLTTIKRTASPIDGFNYNGIVYNHEVGSGQTSGGWNRDENKGGTKANPTQVPERIYWSDAVNPHTYIGYSVPQQEEGVTFDWKMQNTYDATAAAGIDTYYGSLGDPTVAMGYIDYTNDDGETPVPDDPNKPNQALSYKSGNEKIMHDDLLLTYDDKKVAETGGSVAKLYYHHALANVRVVVKISGFSATSESADARSVVKDMVLKDMLTMYKWRQQTYSAEALNETYDKPKLVDIYKNLPSGHTVPEWNQKKDTHLWIPRPNGTGTGVGKQFTFYGLAVPTTMDARALQLQFTVDYQDPMDPWTDANHTTANMKSHTYTATMPTDIVFRAGWCTTINITLNHDNEDMTVGAEYMDWQFTPTPDEGELKKNSTFLTHVDRNKITIFGDDHATVDDATWLYIDKDENYVDKNGIYHPNPLRDIYGHYGTEDDPFVITQAEQMLSFAYEVRGTQRSAGKTYYNVVKGQDVTLTAETPFDFTGYYVTLDADLTLQPTYDVIDENRISWPGIGDATHPFNGIFIGGFRRINSLYGASFFNHIGEEAIVDHILISNALGIVGTGGIAEENDGILYGCHIEGNITAERQTETTEASTVYCGSLVGVNKGAIVACTHVGEIIGYGVVGALVGKNDGILAMCYNCGDAKNTESGENTYPGVGEFTKRSVAYCCYFDNDLYKTRHDYDDLYSREGHVAFPLSTVQMQSNVFVNQEVSVDGNGDVSGGEIIDRRNPLTDPFFGHFSLNAGIKRGLALMKLLRNSDAKDVNGNLLLHSGVSDNDSFEPMPMKQYQVEKLIEYFEDESHRFLFIPGTYPKLQ